MTFRLGHAAALGAAAVLTGTVLAAPAYAAPQPAPALAPLTVKTSLTGTHRWFQQTYQGVPVLGGLYIEHRDRAGRLLSVTDARKTVRGSLAAAPAVRKDSAVRNAQAKVATDAKTRSTAAGARSNAKLAVLPGAASKLVWVVTGTSAKGSTRSIVDAKSGAVLRVESRVRRADDHKSKTGPGAKTDAKLIPRATTPAKTKGEDKTKGMGRVFDPNPLVTLRDPSITDQDDADQLALWPAYKNVILTNLTGDRKLHGDYATIDLGAKTASSRTNSFVYTRHDPRFEQVMAYHHVTSAQLYMQRLGFVDINNQAQKLQPNAIPDDNSFYDPETDVIALGTGGVDDAEDAEVIWHELGHAIQDDQSPGFGETPQAGAIGEGFGDYFAVTMSQPVSKGFDLPCVMDWDATSYTEKAPHCLRRTDTNLTTDDIVGEVHDDGQIWSRALWDINKGLGRTKANKVILESQFFYAPDTTFAAAAKNVVAAARALYGKDAAATCTKAFKDRKIL